MHEIYLISLIDHLLYVLFSLLYIHLVAFAHISFVMKNIDTNIKLIYKDKLHLFIFVKHIFQALKLWDGINCTFPGIFRLDAWNKIAQDWR